MTAFANVCLRLGLPIADEKTVGPCTNIEYLGLTIDSDELLVKIPQDKIEKLLQDQLTSVLSKRKVTICLCWFRVSLPNAKMLKTFQM
jgi:hypothetical protein